MAVFQGVVEDEVVGVVEAVAGEVVVDVGVDVVVHLEDNHQHSNCNTVWTIWMYVWIDFQKTGLLARSLSLVEVRKEK